MFGKSVFGTYRRPGYGFTVTDSLEPGHGEEMGRLVRRGGYLRAFFLTGIEELGKFLSVNQWGS